jgi:hypothetical protein
MDQNNGFRLRVHGDAGVNDAVHGCLGIRLICFADTGMSESNGQAGQPAHAMGAE